MKLLVCNGSPRGVSSNTTLLLGYFLAGFGATPGNCQELFQLNTESGRRDAVAAFAGADAVLIAFPLYTDAMPGIVKEFMEELALYKGKAANPALVFLVQSGFPEGSHTRYLVPYLEKFAGRLGCPYLGTIRRGGVEGIRSQPEFVNRKLFRRLNVLGRGFGATGKLDNKLLATLAGSDQLSKLALLAVNRISELMFWNPQLKRNGAFEHRFARPYEPK